MKAHARKTPHITAALSAVVIVLGMVSHGAAPAWATGTCTVTTTSGGAGVGTLSQAITDANAGSCSSIVFDATFASAQTITLSANLPTITNSVTITGPGRSLLTIDGQDARRIFLVNGASKTVNFSGMTLTHGRDEATGNNLAIGGAVYVSNAAAVSLTDCAITNSLARYTGAATTMGGVRGGAIAAAHGNLTISNTTITGNQAESISGSQTEAIGTASYGGAVFFDGGGSLALTDTTVSDNSATSTLGSAAGGAVTIFSGALALSGTTTMNANSAHSGSGIGMTGYRSAFGGALYVSSAVPLTISGMATLSNSAATASTGPLNGSGGDADGGAMYIAGPTTISGTVAITGSTATGGMSGHPQLGASTTGGAAYGGAIFAYGSSVSLTGVTITGSTAIGGDADSAPVGSNGEGGAVGGAIYAANTTSLTVSSSTISDSHVRGGLTTTPSVYGRGYGAGVLVYNAAGVIFDGVTISDNRPLLTAAVEGGAVNASGTSNVLIANSALTGNYASWGSGVFASSHATVRLSNTTASSNAAVVPISSGVFDAEVASTINVNNSTIASNTAVAVPVFYANGGSVAITNSVVADSGSASANCATANGGTISISYSVSYRGTGAPDACSIGTGVLTSNPMVDALASNGGTTQTMALQASSPALLAADSATCQASPVSGLDQRGVVRPVGRCDVGAYQRSVALTPSGGGTSTPVADEAPAVTTSHAPLNTPPSACVVTGVHVTLGDRSMRVGWAVRGGPCATTATATPVNRASAPTPRDCTTTQTSCVITGLTPGVRYAVTVTAEGGAATVGVSPVQATRILHRYIAIPFMVGSARLTAKAHRMLTQAVSGGAESALVAGYADPSSWRRAGLAQARARAVLAALHEVSPRLRVTVARGAPSNARCVDYAGRCTVLRVTRAVAH
ncbi:MAG: hypothetical protein RL205_1224 [Actinomycetota bacterium]